MHLSQHTVPLKPLSYSALPSFRTFLLSPGSTNMYEHFFCATCMNPTTAVPRSVHLIVWYPVSKGHQTLPIKIFRNGIITRRKKNFLRNFHRLGHWFPAFSQGHHSHHLLPSHLLYCLAHMAGPPALRLLPSAPPWPLQLLLPRSLPISPLLGLHSLLLLPQLVFSTKEHGD